MNDDDYQLYPLSHANVAQTVTVKVMGVVKQRLTDQKPRCRLAVLLVISIVFAPISPSLIYLFPQYGALPCYCCISVDSSCSLKCACGCSHPGSDDQSWEFVALPVSCRLLAFL